MEIVKTIDLRREFEEIEGEISEAINGVIDRGWFIQGDECRQFEADFSNYVGVRHGIGVNSGSDALYLATKALGIGKGDEVITVSHTFVSTVDAIIRNGARAVFVDIRPDNYCIDADEIERNINEKTRAILPVHIYGHPADMTRINELAEKYGLFVIEDSCQAHGARFREKKVGSFGDVACFSFYPTKNLGAYGDAGMIVTDREDLAREIRKLSNYGQTSKYHHDSIGINSRLDELQAAVLRVKLRHLDEWNGRRQRIASLYSNELANLDAVLPRKTENAEHVFHQYAIRVKKRDLVRERLMAKGVQTLIHYPKPVHLQKAYSDLGYSLHLPITEAVSESTISLPMFPQMKEDEISTVTEATRYALG